MARYSLTIFLSAFLLFQLQPLIARIILPWFGGTAAVWTTCMMFFQIMLLLGYTWSHLLRRRLSPKSAWMVQTLLLVIAAWLTSIVPDEHLQPNGNENPTWAILGLLGQTIALPFFVLATTSPLIQAWQSTTHPNRSPYRLYALSNLGSMLALVSYPFLVERYFSVADQTRYWRIAFVTYCVLCGWSGWQAFGESAWRSAGQPSDTPRHSGIRFWTRARQTMVWLILAAAASTVLLATTNLMSQDIASVPFLWILPLALYLASFVICFDMAKLYQRWLFVPLLAVSAMASLLVFHLSVLTGALLQIGVLSMVCFAVAMICHGELERIKPAPEGLTWFYLVLGIGGAVGGIFVSVAAPRWFNGYHEFQIGLLISLIVAAIALYRSMQERPSRSSWVRMLGAWLAASFLFLASSLTVSSLCVNADPSFFPNRIFQSRNEYGLLAVEQENGYRKLIHGQIEHGGQFVDPQQTNFSSYYQPGSGVAIAIEACRQDRRSAPEGEPKGLRVGILGLGVGGMMRWSEPGDTFTFYEINPLVAKIAREYFTYLDDAPGRSEIVAGDGRLQLERRARNRSSNEAATRNENEPFDLLFMDAFSSDSIPVHLITRECFEIYLRNLQPDGMLIAHISNRFVDLRPVVYQNAIDAGLTPILIETKSDEVGYRTRWVLMTRNADILNSETVKQYQTDWPQDMRPIRWTDDYASLFEVIDWSGKIDWDRLSEPRRKSE